MMRGASVGASVRMGGGAQATATWAGVRRSGVWAEATETVPASATVTASVKIRNPIVLSYDFFSFDACAAFSSTMRFWAFSRCSLF